MTPEERTETVLRDLDTLLDSGLDNPTAVTKSASTLRWINANLDRQTIIPLIKSLDLKHEDTILALLADPYFITQ